VSFWRAFSSGTTEAAKPKQGPVSGVSLGLTALTGAGLLYYFQHLQQQKLKAASLKTETAGRAAIGGPFDLLDQDGKPFTHEDLLGKFALIYFGFTYCPDICPDELEKMASAMDLMGKEQSSELQPVFISIDPERDSVAQVKSYIEEFHPRLIGLTGSLEKVKDAARQYRVYYTKTSETEDYLVDHSIIMYLVDPEGCFVTFYGKNFTPEQLSESVADHIRKWQEQHA